MKIRPLFDRIVIEPVDTEEKTKSGIVLLAKDQEKPQMAKVIAVGPGGNVDGKEVVMELKVGDKVLYSKYAGSEFKIDGKDVTIMRQSDVLAVVEK
ncbi:MAG: co-chaperone GroES [Clostridia bacterium]|nr:co-chaperone GroES [Clostridia bacterium]